MSKFLGIISEMNEAHDNYIELAKQLVSALEHEAEVLAQRKSDLDAYRSELDAFSEALKKQSALVNDHSDAVGQLADTVESILSGETSDGADVITLDGEYAYNTLKDIIERNYKKTLPDWKDLVPEWHTHAIVVSTIGDEIRRVMGSKTESNDHQGSLFDE